MRKNKEKNYLSVVIYIYNNEKEIKKYLSKIYKLLESYFEKIEIICVNDASTDMSVKEIKKSLKQEFLTLNIINMSYHEGIEKSMVAGTNLAIGDFIIEIDSINLDYELEKLIEIYYECLKGYDIVTLSPNSNTIKSKIFYKIFNKYSKTKNKIYTEKARILSRRAINRLGMMFNQILYRKIAYLNCGLKTKNIKYENNFKQKSLSTRELAIDSLLIFTEAGYKFSLFMSALMIISIIFMASYTLIFYLYKKPIEGWTTTLLFLSFCFFGLFVLLTIIIKYLSLIIENSYYKDYNNISSIEKISKD